MNEKELKRLTEQYRESREYASLMSLPAFARFLSDLEAERSKVLEQAGTVGFANPSEESQALSRARSLREVALWPAARAARVHDLSRRLQEAGVALDAEL